MFCTNSVACNFVLNPSVYFHFSQRFWYLFLDIISHRFGGSTTYHFIALTFPICLSPSGNLIMHDVIMICHCNCQFRKIRPLLHRTLVQIVEYQGACSHRSWEKYDILCDDVSRVSNSSPAKYLFPAKPVLASEVFYLGVGRIPFRSRSKWKMYPYQILRTREMRQNLQ